MDIPAAYAPALDACASETDADAIGLVASFQHDTGVQTGTSGPLAIGHATSEDGIRRTGDDGPVLRPSDDPDDFDGIHVAEPGASVLGDDTPTGSRAPTPRFRINP